MPELENQEPVHGKWYRNGFLTKDGPIKWYHYRWTDQDGWHKKRCLIVPKTASTKVVHQFDKRDKRVTIQFESQTETFQVKRYAIALGYWLEQKEDPTVYVYCPVRNNPDQHEWRCRIEFTTGKLLATVRFEDGTIDRVVLARLQVANEKQLAAPAPPPISAMVKKAKESKEAARPEYVYSTDPCLQTSPDPSGRKCLVIRRGRGEDKGFSFVRFENGTTLRVMNHHLRRIGPAPKRRPKKRTVNPAEVSLLTRKPAD